MREGRGRRERGVVKEKEGGERETRKCQGRNDL